MNRTMFQFFHWYYPGDKNLWLDASAYSSHLQSLGVSHVWLPPAYKSFKGADEPGYGVYDLYDLGEFDQKGSVKTKWGTREEYLQCIRSLQEHGIKVLADIVLNHMLGGDENEKIEVLWVNKENRNEVLCEPEQIEDNTKFTFPGRNGKYSQFVWDHHCFTGIDHDNKVALVRNDYTKEGWDDCLDTSNGNYDFLLGNDIEFRNPEVKKEIFRWIEWYVNTTKVDGFRIDGIKHINSNFFNEFLDHIEQATGRKFFSVGEFWKDEVDLLLDYINVSKGRIQLFDVPLHYKFHEASQKGKDFDLRTIFDNTLLQLTPELAITFVENHDTQPLQGLESSVEQWFKPLAYALILLREQGLPCVFFADLYGANYKDVKDGEEKQIEIVQAYLLPEMMRLRQSSSYGLQRDYFDDRHSIGWIREGIEDMPDTGLAVLITNREFAQKQMSLGQKNAYRKMYNLSKDFTEPIILDSNGEAIFRCEGQIGIWSFRQNTE